MKIRNKLFLLALSATLGLASCDDGLIEEKTTTAEHTGYTIKMTGDITGANTWSDNYKLVFAAFSDDSEYAIVQQRVPTTAADGVNLTIYDVDASATTLELCVTDKLRRRVLTLKSMNITTEANPKDTVRFELGSVNASMFAAIQTSVFDVTCAQCHGGSNTAAAGLYLTDGNAYANLVNVASTVVDGGIRVVPGNAEESVLHNVINPGNVAGLSFDHESMINDEEILELIDDWIDGGAYE